MDRTETLRTIDRTSSADAPFDVLVIGGGITGAGIAREAALAGLRTALLERGDFAGGTSSRSSRLIHGGVRYLEHGHLGLVYEASRERRLLLQLAPHLVRPLAFTWPVYRGARVPRWKLRAGLALYDALALFGNVHRHEALDAAGVLAAEPALARDALVGGARYWDAATDDTRLTLCTVLAARETGALVANHCDVARGWHEHGRLIGVHAVDTLTGAPLSARAHVIVNATGPWSDLTTTLTGESGGTADQTAQVRGSAGAHLAVPRHRLGTHDAVTMVSPLDGRVMFVLPAGPHGIIGTTERPAHRGPDAIRATDADVSYLLESVNRLFPNAALTPDDVISAWCGIRPLAAATAGGRGASAASREHAIATRADGLLSVTGGKLTTYRAMAADVLHAVFAAMGSHRPTWPASRADERLSHERSPREPLPGGDIDSLAVVTAQAHESVHDRAVAERLAGAYGSRWCNVWSYAQRDPALATRISDALPYICAEVVHAAERELACTLSDVMVRRTHVAFETRDHGVAAAERIAPLLQRVLGWSDAEREAQLVAYRAEVANLFTIDGMVAGTAA